MNLKEIRARKEVSLQRLADLDAAETALLNGQDTAYFERMLGLLKTIKEAKDCRIAVRGDSGSWVNVIPPSGACGEALARIAQRMVLERITNRAINAERKPDGDDQIIIPSKDLLPGV